MSTRFRKPLTILVPLLLGAAAFFAVWNPFESVDHTAWEADFDILLGDLSRGYANLDWLASSGRIKPAPLASETRRTLREAHSNNEARAAIYSFIDAFHDPHLRVEGRRNWMPRFLRSGRRLDIDYRGSAYQPLPAGTFDAGLLSLGGGRSAGVIRIERFGHETYADVMASAKGDDRAAMRVLVQKLDERIGQIKKRGASVVMIDITGNGGGTDWADGAARLLSAQPLRYGGGGFVRHPHHTAQFAAQRAALERDKTNPTLRPEQHAVVNRALAELTRLETEAREDCDRSAVWTPTGARCSSLIRTQGGGLAGYVPPGLLDGMASAPALFFEDSLRVREGTWTGPVAVLMDGRTASASEQFAALLRDNGAALLIGQRSLGAGCGYTNEAIQSKLPHSGIVVKMPDCARFRASGENEIAGLSPDEPVVNAAELTSVLLRMAQGKLRLGPVSRESPPPAPARP
ncbi:MAG: S41 family peptidase [Acidobacteriota bacterium]